MQLFDKISNVITVIRSIIILYTNNDVHFLERKKKEPSRAQGTMARECETAALQTGAPSAAAFVIACGRQDRAGRCGAARQQLWHRQRRPLAPLLLPLGHGRLCKGSHCAGSARSARCACCAAGACADVARSSLACMRGGLCKMQPHVHMRCSTRCMRRGRRGGVGRQPSGRAW